MSDKLYDQLLRTAEEAGIHIVGKQKAAQLLALVLLFGSEEFVYCRRLNSDVRMSAKRFGFDGGKVPDKKAVVKITKYAIEIKNCIRTKKDKPQWLKDIERDYYIDIPWGEEALS